MTYDEEVAYHHIQNLVNALSTDLESLLEVVDSPFILHLDMDKKELKKFKKKIKKTIKAIKEENYEDAPLLSDWIKEELT